MLNVNPFFYWNIRRKKKERKEMNKYDRIYWKCSCYFYYCLFFFLSSHVKRNKQTGIQLRMYICIELIDLLRMKQKKKKHLNQIDLTSQ